MMENYNKWVEIKHNPNCLYIPDHPYTFLIIGGSRSGKTNVLLNLINHQQPIIDKIYLHVKDPFEWKYQLLINARENVGIENLKNSKTFIDYSRKKKMFMKMLIKFWKIMTPQQKGEP